MLFCVKYCINKLILKIDPITDKITNNPSGVDTEITDVKTIFTYVKNIILSQKESLESQFELMWLNVINEVVFPHSLTEGQTPSYPDRVYVYYYFDTGPDHNICLQHQGRFTNYLMQQSIKWCRIDSYMMLNEKTPFIMRDWWNAKNRGVSEFGEGRVFLGKSEFYSQELVIPYDSVAKPIENYDVETYVLPDGFTLVDMDVPNPEYEIYEEWLTSPPPQYLTPLKGKQDIGLLNPPVVIEDYDEETYVLEEGYVLVDIPVPNSDYTTYQSYVATPPEELIPGKGTLEDHEHYINSIYDLVNSEATKCLYGRYHISYIKNMNDVKYIKIKSKNFRNIVMSCEIGKYEALRTALNSYLSPSQIISYQELYSCNNFYFRVDIDEDGFESSTTRLDDSGFLYTNYTVRITDLPKPDPLIFPTFDETEIETNTEEEENPTTPPP